MVKSSEFVKFFNSGLKKDHLNDELNFSGYCLFPALASGFKMSTKHNVYIYVFW